MANHIKQLGSIERRLSKKEIEYIAKSDSKKVIDSDDYDILKTYVELKRYQTYLKAVLIEFKHAALEQALAEGKKSFEYNKAQVKIIQRNIWDYSVDSVWKGIDSNIVELKKEKKLREKFLKESNEKGSLLDYETGELIEDYKLPVRVEKNLNIRMKYTK